MVKERKVSAFVFTGVTLIYLTTKWYTFLSFNGADDLHYAMLSSRMLLGTYSPFVPNDIFCGRILLISLQSIIYFFGGISIFTTQIGTISATIWSCYLTIFKIIRPKDYLQVLLASSFFYFNPVLSESTLGILPDAYVMLIGIYLVLAIKPIVSHFDKRKQLIQSFLLGILISISLLIKEITIIFLFFALTMIFVSKPKYLLQKTTALLLGFGLMTILTGIYYYLHTGNFFFKIAQINNSDYQYAIHQDFNFKQWIIRLTYGPWKAFTAHGFYPVNIAALVLCASFFKEGWQFVKRHYYLLSFLVLLTISLYFPFSLHHFKPLDVGERHFIFLLPLAVAISSDYIYKHLTPAAKTQPVLLIFLFLLFICIFSTSHMWQWMIYGLITLLFFLIPHLPLKLNTSVFVVCSIFWLSILEPVFIHNAPWFKEMQALNKNISGNSFYFIDHDHMMHWELIRKFDTTKRYYDIDKNQFFLFKPYDSRLSTGEFRPGWLIINKTFSPPPGFESILSELQSMDVYKKHITYPHIEAVYIENELTLDTITK